MQTEFETVGQHSVQVQVSEVISSRYDSEPHIVRQIESDRWYQSGTRKPLSWDLRKAGIDLIKTVSGETIRLYSDGGQSVPAPGWTLLLTGGTAAAGFRWTLYGITDLG